MRLFDSLEIAGSSLTAHRLWMDLISQNLANVNTTRTPEGGPYKRRVPVFAERLQSMNNDFKGVGVERIEADDLPPRMVYQPEHPDADAQGYVAYPNVNVVREMTDMMVATRAYEANLMVVESAKEIWGSAIDVLRS
ncbi:flagellar basal-body rod protein FlgC [Acetomicrobium mobile DSM 13181]|uniref:Flagellar basal-body rod protein FlgC n=1 Tax=Acetomicrobium mobile (strain ATCC BAA-54 / DSM 13181 / JCM 12221 / NGA) TaxID=891968 RepID=I4BUG2_ACEMN|nr:flagellar basal body rod protein FlgC [Acetomicrobium mobile]AFM20919.1 flagellar basal-body rod protein FlgC [Acetomicrobium mobile DSM 13181]